LSVAELLRWSRGGGEVGSGGEEEEVSWAGGGSELETSHSRQPAVQRFLRSGAVQVRVRARVRTWVVRAKV
jgi:hypothetical protein